jgi:hypothetical protein
MSGQHTSRRADFRRQTGTFRDALSEHATVCAEQASGFRRQTGTFRDALSEHATVCAEQASGFPKVAPQDSFSVIAGMLFRRSGVIVPFATDRAASTIVGS